MNIHVVIPVEAWERKGMNETLLLAGVRELALLCDWKFYHTHRSQFSEAGFPDIIACKGTRQVAAELKVGKNNLTAEQYFWLLALHDAGAEVYVWWGTDQDWEEIQRVFWDGDSEI